ncbi:MAG: hypothetical protein DKT66_25600 [Candidatus Melainabacteria bacterium]|nr:MAG: hypothetical protein DKT66_25600 [Candidatus Melainabacteria bacterium]
MGQFENSKQTELAKSNNTDSSNAALDGASILFDQGKFVRSANPPAEGVMLAQSQAPGPLFQQGTGSSFRDALRSRLHNGSGDQIGQPLPAGDVANPGDGANPGGVQRQLAQPRFVQQGEFPQRYPTVTQRVPTPVSDLPRYKYFPPSQDQPSLLEDTGIKKTNLDEPYISKTSDDGNALFEALARAGASAIFINKDHVARTAAVEKQIAATELVSPGAKQSFQMARDGLLNGLKVPIQNAEVAMEGLYKRYPIELFQGASIPKIGGTGKIMMPHPWDLDQLSLVDQAHAEKYLNLTSLREQLVAHWPPVASTQLGRLPTGVASMPIVKAEGLLAEAAKFDAAGSAFTGEVSKTLANNEALRAANSTHLFKSVGVMAGAWMTNVVTDNLVNTKHGPSAVVWGADLISPAILFTNRSMLTKFGVVAGSHLVAKLYDKYNEK